MKREFNKALVKNWQELENSLKIELTEEQAKEFDEMGKETFDNVGKHLLHLGGYGEKIKNALISSIKQGFQIKELTPYHNTVVEIYISDCDLYYSVDFFKNRDGSIYNVTAYYNLDLVLEIIGDEYDDGTLDQMVEDHQAKKSK